MDGLRRLANWFFKEIHVHAPSKLVACSHQQLPKASDHASEPFARVTGLESKGPEDGTNTICLARCLCVSSARIWSGKKGRSHKKGNRRAWKTLRGVGEHSRDTRRTKGHSKGHLWPSGFAERERGRTSGFM